MKNAIHYLAIFFFCSINVFSGEKPNLKNITGGISFTENKGQVCDQNSKSRPDILFSGVDGGMAFHIRNNGISYQLSKIDSYKQDVDSRSSITRRLIEKATIYRVDSYWKDCNTDFIIEKKEENSETSNYYRENCADGVFNVKSYTNVFLRNIYDNIDLHYYESEGRLKYDYIVAPGADYKRIKIEVRGAEIKIKKNGNIVFVTPLGNIEEEKPVVFQNKKQLLAKWILEGNVLSFEIKNADAAYPIIIDPLIRNWGTYYGEDSEDEGRSCVVDASGNVYLWGTVGYDFSNGLLSTSGAHQTTYGGNTYDCFLVKFDKSGNRLWGTYYGGNGNETAFKCSIDASSNVYVTGYTGSTNAIASPGAHQTAKSGSEDAFLVKFNSNGVRQWGTFYGGTGSERGFSCTVDLNGDVLMAGFTSSSSGIATAGVHQTGFAGGTYDAFVVKFSPSGSRIWGTYLGGNGSETAYGVTTDPSGNVFLSGTTTTTVAGIAIATPGAFQTTPGIGFLVKFNSTGTRQWGTYFNATGYACSSDLSGNIYMTGDAFSTSGISTAGAHQQIYGGGNSDSYLVKFDNSGSRQWCTYYGDTDLDDGWSCITDPSGNIFIAGQSRAAGNYSAIATAGSYQSNNKGWYNGYLAQFNSSGARTWATYYGGYGYDYAFDCSLDPLGNIYLCGSATSTSAYDIATMNSFQPYKQGSSGTYDAYVARFCIPPSAPGPLSGPNVLCNGSNAVTYSLSPVSTATVYNWSYPSGWNSFGSYTNTISIIPNSSSGTVSVTINDGCTNSPPSVYSVTINPLPDISILTSDSTICGPPAQESATLTASGATSYTWNTSAITTSIVVSPSVSTNYIVNGTDANGCQNTAIITQSVSACVGINELQTNKINAEVYPNPNSGSINLVLQSLSGGDELEIYNSIGQLVLKYNITELKSVYDLSKLSPGIYQLVIKQNAYGVYSKKIIRE